MLLRASRAVFVTFALACAIAACGKQEPARAPSPPPSAQQTAPAPPPAAAAVEKPAAPAPAAQPAPASAPAPAPIGTIDSLDGEVRLTRAGTARAAQAGMALEPGDALETGPQSWALLAMSDGASVTIRPDTSMKIDTYRYVPDGPPAENAANWSLVKGALRSVTGLVGKLNRTGYTVATPSATIGIRGTDHEPAYYPPPAPGQRAEHPPGTYDKVNSGESVIRSPRGTVPVRRGQTAFANADARARPQILAKPPAFYQRQAQIDRRVQLRREQFHRQYNQEQQKRAAVVRAQQQQQRLDAQQQQQDARRGEQDKRRAEQQRSAETRRLDQQKKAEQKKAEPRKPPEKKAPESKADQRKWKDRQAEKAAPAQRSQPSPPPQPQRPQREAQPQRPQPPRESQPQRPQQQQRPEAKRNEKEQRKGEEGRR
jgi:hypothetical protein